MKKVVLLLAILSISGCHQNQTLNDPAPSPKAVACDLNQNYARTVAEASKRLPGQWKLKAILEGWVTPKTIPDETITFLEEGTFQVVREGKPLPLSRYSVTLIT